MCHNKLFASDTYPCTACEVCTEFHTKFASSVAVLNSDVNKGGDTDVAEDYDVNPLKEIIEKADVRLFNLENVLSDKPIYSSSIRVRMEHAACILM